MIAVADKVHWEDSFRSTPDPRGGKIVDSPRRSSFASPVFPHKPSATAPVQSFQKIPLKLIPVSSFFSGGEATPSVARPRAKAEAEAVHRSRPITSPACRRG